eukprot:691789_1
MDSFPEHSKSTVVKFEQDDVPLENDAVVFKVEPTDDCVFAQHEDTVGVPHNVSGSVSEGSLDVLRNPVPVGYMSSLTSSVPAQIPHLEGVFSCRSCHKSFGLKVNLIRHV